VDLGVKPTSIGPALNLIIAQRLVRRLCEKCKILNKESELKSKLEKFVKSLPDRVAKEDYKKINLFSTADKKNNCLDCAGRGYKGRIGIYELLPVSKEIEKLMNKKAGEIEIQEFALQQGMVTMQQDGLLKVASGITTLEEVEKATGPIQI